MTSPLTSKARIAADCKSDKIACGAKAKAKAKATATAMAMAGKA